VKTLFVHIGTHKTGTTSIQAYLSKHAALLLRRGLYVPAIGSVWEHSGHHNVAWGLRDDPRFKPELGGFNELLLALRAASVDRAVISAEDLEYLVQYPDRLRQFETQLREAGWQPSYIVFFRRPDHYARSLYCELAGGHGLTLGFSTFISHILRDGFFTMWGDWCFYFDYSEFLRRWREAATGPLQAISYDRAVKHPGLIQAFLEALGVPASGLPVATERFNTRAPVPIPPLQRHLGAYRLRRRFPSWINLTVAVRFVQSPSH
jgi:hypothetical protein